MKTMSGMYEHYQEVYWTEIGLFDFISKRDATSSDTLCTSNK